MTVHGAKGLEAPIVILPDTALRQDGGNPPQVAAARRRPARPGARARTRRPPALAAAEAARRALRAGGEPAAALRGADPRAALADRLRRRRGQPKAAATSWHGLVAEAMAGARPRRASPAPDGDVAGAVAQLERGRGRAAPARRRPRRPPCPPGRRRPAAAAAGGGRAALSPSALGGDAWRWRRDGARRGPRRGRGARRGDAPAARASCTAGPRPSWPRSPRGSCRRRADLPELLAEAAARARTRPSSPRSSARARLRRGRGDRGAARARRAPHPRPDRPAGGRARPGAGGRFQEQPRRAGRARRRCPRGSCARWAPTARRSPRSGRAGAVETAVLWTRAPRLMPLPAARWWTAALARAGHLDPPGARP